MRKLIGLVLLSAAAVLFASGCSNVSEPGGGEGLDLEASVVADGAAAIPDIAVTADLIACRTEKIGVVGCWIHGDSFFVQYSITSPGWEILETQLVAAGTVNDIDRTRTGAPKIGHFPWKEEFDPPVQGYLYSIPLSELGFDYIGEFVVAAHADVLYTSDDGESDKEGGAWASGERFVVDVEFDGTRIADDEYSTSLKADAVSQVIDELSADSGNWSMYFTVTGWQITVRELLINEVYYAGCDNSRFYFYDQFVELYNTSDETLYLDGCIITRNYPSSLEDIEAIDYVRGTYAFQFPGVPVTGREYPIQPGQHVVIASDAVDHSLYANNGVDLSSADWEFFNQLGSDYDNPDVPNLVSIHPTSTADYMINLAHNAVVLATGEEYWFETYYSGTTEKVRIAIPLYTVLDGVEYSSSADVTKELTVRIDAGLAGIGLAKYSACSVERLLPGLDSNNSTFDFGIICPPSPGYQH